MIENPFRAIRRKLRLPMRGIRGLSLGTVQRIERGHYEQISDGMADALFTEVEAAGANVDLMVAELERVFGTPYLVEAYRRWRTLHRKESGSAAEWPTIAQIEAGAQEQRISPVLAFTRLVSASLGSFCDDYCLQAVTVRSYAAGRFTYLVPPKSFVTAMQEAGYPYLEQLVELHREWVDNRR